VKETRVFAAPVEARESSDGTPTIAGYAAVFDTPYEMSGFTESVDPRAFNKTLKERDDLAVVWSHDADRVLGTQASGSARFSIDEHGLAYEADLDLADPDGMSAYRKIVTGKVRQSSFSFEVVKDKWEEREDGPPHRTLKEVRLWEASPVLWPASPVTEVDVKSALASYAEYRGVDPDPDATIATIRDATATEPDAEPQEHSEVPPEPERPPVYQPGM